MASELRVNTLKDASGNNSVGMAYVAEGSAKAWVKYLTNSGTSTDDSFNQSSIVDDATGRTNFNWTNAFGSVNYTASGNNSDRKINNSAFANTASQGRAIMYHTQDNVDTDTSGCSIVCHGDLA